MLEINGDSGSKEPEPFIEYDPESDSVNVGVRIPKDYKLGERTVLLYIYFRT